MSKNNHHQKDDLPADSQKAQAPEKEVIKSRPTFAESPNVKMERDGQVTDVRNNASVDAMEAQGWKLVL